MLSSWVLAGRWKGERCLIPIFLLQYIGNVDYCKNQYLMYIEYDFITATFPYYASLFGRASSDSDSL